MNKFFSLITIFLSSLVFSQTPGGVVGEDLWYKTDATTVTNSEYADYGPNEYEITGTSVTADLFNFNHSLNFEENTYLSFPYSVEDMKVATIFMVYTYPTAVKQSLIYSDWRAGSYEGNGNNEKQFFYTTRKLIKEDLDLSYPEESEEAVANALVNTLNWFDFNSTHINNSTGVGGESDVFIGKFNDAADNYVGSIPEFIIYRKALSKEERERVESYLAIKYGITLTPEVSYYNSDYDIIWDRHNNFNNRIFAIGRDDVSGLYQKQSTSSHTENQEVILNAAELEENNDLNEFIFENDHDFIFIGDNNGSMIIEGTGEEGIGDWGLHPMERVWLAHPYGETADEIETELRYNAAHLIDKIHEDYLPEFWEDITVWLLINRDGDEVEVADFDFDQVDAYMVDAVEGDHVVYYEQIWDEDASEFDQFTFAIGPKMLVEITLQEMDCEDEEGNIDVQLTFGEANFDFEILDENGAPINDPAPVFDWATRNITLEDIPNGWYTLRVTDGTGYVREVDFEVSPTAGMNENILEDEYTMVDDPTTPANDPMVVIDASENVTASGVTYEWFKGLVSIGTSADMLIDKPGTYRVVLTNENGCQVEDTTIVIQEGALKSPEEEIVNDDELAQETIIIYPNPTKVNNSFTVEISLLEKQEAQIQIYDYAGSLIHNELLKDSSNYKWSHRIMQPGSYLISVITKNQKLTKKLIVK